MTNPVPIATIVFPGSIADLLCEIDAVTQEQIDAGAGELPPVMSGDIIKGKVEPFVQKLLVIGTQKSHESDQAEKSCREEDDRRICLDISVIYALISLLIGSVLTAGELCDDRFEAKICKNYILVIREAEVDVEVEIDPDDEYEIEDEDVISSVPPKNKQH